MSEKTYLVATIRPWNVDAYHRYSSSMKGKWQIVHGKNELTVERVRELAPRYIFFPHWSWKVPEEILEIAECVCFHLTDLPYGRGGSPLQNLIVRGHKESKLTAFRMTEDMDAGPIYLKRLLDLSGRAQEIFNSIAGKIWEMIKVIVETEPEPVPQLGEPTFFKRRTPDQSALPVEGSIEELYDHIRMLDAETYPLAFLEHGEFRLEFSNAKLLGDGSLAAKVVVKKR